MPCIVLCQSNAAQKQLKVVIFYIGFGLCGIQCFDILVILRADHFFGKNYPTFLLNELVFQSDDAVETKKDEDGLTSEAGKLSSKLMDPGLKPFTIYQNMWLDFSYLIFEFFYLIFCMKFQTKP